MQPELKFGGYIIPDTIYYGQLFFDSNIILVQRNPTITKNLAVVWVSR